MAKIDRVLGPCGLMPSPKTGTRTPDVAKAVQDSRAVRLRPRRQAGQPAFVIGKVSFDETKLAEDHGGAAIDEIMRAKPSSSKAAT